MRAANPKSFIDLQAVRGENGNAPKEASTYDEVGHHGRPWKGASGVWGFKSVATPAAPGSIRIAIKGEK